MKASKSVATAFELQDERVRKASCTVQVLHEGKLAEMRTGEGKTLVAVLPAYLNALAGKGVQVQKTIAQFWTVLNSSRHDGPLYKLAIRFGMLPWYSIGWPSESCPSAPIGRVAKTK